MDQTEKAEDVVADKTPEAAEEFTLTDEELATAARFVVLLQSDGIRGLLFGCAIVDLEDGSEVMAELLDTSIRAIINNWSQRGCAMTASARFASVADSVRLVLGTLGKVKNTFPADMMPGDAMMSKCADEFYEQIRRQAAAELAKR